MSIEYFVEGKVISQTEGDHLTFSKGNIAHNGTENVLQKGGDTGISYSNPNELHPNDKPVNTIDVSLNLFFDGTQNNKTNTEAGIGSSSSNGKDSYANDYSNVARGYDAIDPNAERQTAIYVEGIGTVDGKRDTAKIYDDAPNNLGSPMGMGDRGIEAKVTKGCLEGAKAVSNKAKNKEIDVLKVNVFGFSRGAAAARHFIHIATKAVAPIMIQRKYTVLAPHVYEKSNQDQNTEQNIVVPDNKDPLLMYGYFGACLIKNGVKVKNVIFNFVGLYDTVASYGANHRGFKVGSVSIIDDDAGQLNLNAINKAHFILQIASDNEYRANFSLTDIKSTGLYGLEFTLPGVHSDIGGSYKDGDIEKSNLFRGSEDDCKRMKEILIEEGWFSKGQLDVFKLTKYIGTENYNYTYSTKYELRGTRTLSNHYDKIPLNVMFNFSKEEQFGVKYTDELLKDHDITNHDIQEAYSKLLEYMNLCVNIRNRYVADFKDKKNPSVSQYQKDIKSISYLSKIDDILLKKLRNNFFHWSVNVGEGGTGMGPNVKNVANEEQRKRYIIQG